MEVPAEEILEVSRLLEHNSVLLVLKLNGVGLEDVGASHLARAIKKNHTLREFQ